jgi:hypothetical protein
MTSRKKPQPILDPSSLMTPAQVCAELLINRRTLQRYCHSKPPKLGYIRLSANCIRFRRQLVEYFKRLRSVGDFQTEGAD